MLPLAVNARWGRHVEREGGWYCWRVETKRKQALRIEGYAAHHRSLVYTLACRTNPDHQLVDIAPGLGITRYVYQHHGTVASADVRLVAFRAGK